MAYEFMKISKNNFSRGYKHSFPMGNIQSCLQSCSRHLQNLIPQSIALQKKCRETEIEQKGENIGERESYWPGRNLGIKLERVKKRRNA